MPEIDAPRWGQFLALHPEAHLLQTAAWAELKRPFGWTPAWVQSGDLGAQILFRRLPLGLTIAYLPKGPVLPPGSPPGGWEPFYAPQHPHPQGDP